MPMPYKLHDSGTKEGFGLTILLYVQELEATTTGVERRDEKEWVQRSVGLLHYGSCCPSDQPVRIGDIAKLPLLTLAVLHTLSVNTTLTFRWGLSETCP